MAVKRSRLKTDRRDKSIPGGRVVAGDKYGNDQRNNFYSYPPHYEQHAIFPAAIRVTSSGPSGTKLQRNVRESSAPNPERATNGCLHQALFGSSCAGRIA